MENKYLTKFYKKSHSDKIKALKDANVISDEDFIKLNNKTLNLPPTIADEMIENYITNYELPFGIAMNFLINEKEMLIPMVTEEPSVIAAASNAAKIVAASNGFKTEMPERLMVGQIAFTNVENIKDKAIDIKNNEQEILQLANESYPSLQNYGGGARKIKVRIISADDEYQTPEFLVVHLLVDTAEAMGANIVNTMTETISSFIQNLVSGDNLMNILSNYATESIATATCCIHPKYLATKEISGELVRDRIIQANQFALIDPYRATTHNKGIMNGIDSVLVATGNDWRAVEAGVHAYAARDGKYHALTQWTKNDEGYLIGKINLPISIGSVGGTLSIHPTAQFAYQLLDEPDVKELSQILAAVGLAQNLAAIRALVTEGIQKGHMGLQARSLAIQIGAEGKNIDLVATLLQKEQHMNQETARKLLNNILNLTKEELN